MKGITKIELTNVKTGEKEVITKTNMITNGLNEFFDFPIANTKGSPYQQLDFVQPIEWENNEQSLHYGPLCSSLMGGIYLWEDALNENVDDYELPTDNKAIGAAAYKRASTESNFLGTYNSLESGYDAGGFRFVYDWGTSQANGQISALSLTPWFMGASGLGNEDGIYYPSVSSEEVSCCIYNMFNKKYYKSPYSESYASPSGITGSNVGAVIDTEEGYDMIPSYNLSYSPSYASEHISVSRELKISRNINIDLKNINILKNNTLDNINETIPIPDTIELTTSSYYVIKFKNRICLYIYYSSTDVVRIWEYNTITKTWSTGYDVPAGTSYNRTYLLYVDDNIVVTRVYVRSGVYAIRIYNKSNGVYQDLADSITSSSILPVMYTDRYVVYTYKSSGVQRHFLLNFNDMKIYEYYARSYYNTSSQFYDCYARYNDRITALYSYSSSGMCGVYNLFMLMTKNNLDSPVTKSADQTMKITYTLLPEGG